MASEKQTDPLYWKNKLAGLDKLPGEACDQNAAWERLHARLQEKPVRKQYTWYWAAACLLLVTALSLLLTKHTDTLPAKDFVQQPSTTSPLPLAADKTDHLPNIASGPAGKEIVKQHTAGAVKHLVNDKRIKKLQPVAVGNREAVAIPPDIVVAVPDTQTATAAVVPAKKKLPVVHINELGKQERENARFASENHWPSFQIKFFNGDSYSGAPLPAGGTTQEMLKIKIPLKN